MNDALTTFRTSLEELQREVKAGDKQENRPPVDRLLVRGLLLSLGELLDDGPAETIADDLKKARAWMAQLGSRWDKAMVAEMQLACGEHIQGIDPRYLSHPRYDFEYALEARERLAMRLAALEALEQQVDHDLLDRVAQADERLSDALDDRDGGESINGTQEPAG